MYFVLLSDREDRKHVFGFLFFFFTFLTEVNISSSNFVVHYGEKYIF